MSSRISTQCGQKSNVRFLAALAWRVVEPQHQNSTRSLVDSDDEQELLEELIESVKPPLTRPSKVHYLLFTPFRYPPLKHGSRFGSRHERGIWYGSLEIETALAEVAYYRFLLREHSSARFGTLRMDLSSFSANVATKHGIDLCRKASSRFKKEISDPQSHTASQALGTTMRNGGVEAAVYWSARAPEAKNVAVFALRAFEKSRPNEPFTTWRCVTTDDVVEFKRANFHRHSPPIVFTKSSFYVRDRFPICA